MPELPEVETIKRDLNKYLIGKEIDEVKVHYEKIIKYPSATIFKEDLKGKKVSSVSRRGKYLMVNFCNNHTLVIHLRMTGRIIYQEKRVPTSKHDHLVFHFNDESTLYYNDIRKFGTMWYLDSGNLDIIKGLKELGCEPFSDEFTVKYLTDKLLKTKRNIKSLLLDQRTVAGLGNIYVDEALFKSKIHPEYPANQLKASKIKSLHKNVIEVLQAGIENRGTTFSDYLDGQGEKGGFQNLLSVYGRKGEKCCQCETTIIKKNISGRGTSFCPSCQTK